MNGIDVLIKFLLKEVHLQIVFTDKLVFLPSLFILIECKFLVNSLNNSQYLRYPNPFDNIDISDDFQVILDYFLQGYLTTYLEI
jgi:hypothetical protein